ncbi:DUF5979 domain-containing protein [Pseudoramibacter alactolyticus]|uniref:DUF7601 domain-containing protein n=1 Tax=Pseudoramibacter alactolyticus TaxID=113287 RepID=UPI0028E7EF3F|nr:DUF5979 domain-containing protein [Pseudoramibacter alactolyticus]
MERMKRRRWLWLGVLIALLSLAALLPSGVLAAENTATPPKFEKKLDPNGDGTYKLSLSVTGTASSTSESSKADVVIVFDISNSMDEETNTYVEYATGRYGSVSSDAPTGSSTRRRLYRRSTNNWGYYQYTEITNDTTSGTVYYLGDNYQYHEYTGKRYSQKTRLDVAKSATNTMIDQLLANNATNPGSVRISLVSFDTFASNATVWSTSSENLHSIVNGYKTPQSSHLGGHRGGTNWEDALQKADGTQPRADAKKHVIFVSDGNPTFRISSISGNPDDRYNDVHGHGDDDYYHSHPNYNYDAAKDDAKKIVDGGAAFYTVGTFGDAARMQNLATDAGASDNYYKADDEAALKAAFKNIVASITHSMGYKNVTLKDGLTSLTSSAFVHGKPGDFKYTKNGAAWTPPDAQKARVNGNQVIWDLGDMELEDGVTYTLSFTVWPNQEAYDLVADLNNGVKTYDSLSADEKSQIVKDGDRYSLKTNTDTGNGITFTQIETRTTNVLPKGATPNPDGSYSHDGFTYKKNVDGTWTGTKQANGSGNFTNPKPIPLTGTKIKVKKIWTDNLDPDRPESIKLTLYRDKGQATQTATPIELKNSNSWEKEISIAPGLQTDADGVLEAGHDYIIEEASTGTKYEFNSPTYHPMLNNSATAMIDKNNHNAPLTELKATNIRRGRIEITKKVLPEGTEIPDGTRFKFKLTLTKPGGGTDTNAYAYTVRDKDGHPVSEAGGTVTSGGTIVLEAGQTASIPNLPSGTKYTVEETDLPDSYKHAASDETYEHWIGTASNMTKKDDDNGHMVEGNTASRVTFTNHAKSFTLTLRKCVDGNMGDKNKKFKFTLNLTKALAETPSGWIQANDSMKVFTAQLKNGDALSLTLPYGATYTITEDTAAPDGYTTQYAITASGTEPGLADYKQNLTTGKQTLKRGAWITFRNRREVIPASGLKKHPLPAVLALVSGAGFGVALHFRRRRNAA